MSKIEQIQSTSHAMNNGPASPHRVMPGLLLSGS